MVNIIYDYSAECKTETDVIIAKQEHKDTYIAANAIGAFFSGDITVTQFPQFSAVDTSISYVNKNGEEKEIYMEIKEAHLKQETIEKYGQKQFLLKKDKLDGMRKKANGKKLLYTLLVNENEFVVFDCDKIDWDSLKLIPLKQRKTQADPNSPYVYKLTYIIPIKEALATKTVDWWYWCYEEFEEKPNFVINA